MPNMPTFCGWSVARALKPKMVQAAGIPDFSIKFLNSFSAFPKITPCPKMTKGFLALLIKATASSIKLLRMTGFGR